MNSRVINELLTTIKYCRVTLTDKTSFFLRVTFENAQFLVGVEVKRNGDEVKPKDADERVQLIEKKLIKKLVRYGMSKKYGTLEVIKE